MACLDSMAKIKELVFDSVFKRALDIASSDSLLGISFAGDYLETCDAECIGSSSTDMYRLNVKVIGDKAVGKCSCPASAKAKDGLCKHVIALLLRRNGKLQEKSACGIRGRKQDAVDDEYPIENIGSPDEEEEEAAVVSPLEARELLCIENGSKPATPRPVLKQSSSRRALPAWMLGVVGSAESGESSKASKSKGKVPTEKPTRAPPPPAKRARRQGQPLKVSNDPYEEDGPGEIDVAEPVDEPLEVGEPVVEDAEKFNEATSGKRTGDMRKPKLHAGEIESNKGDENFGARKGRSQAPRRSKSRRVVGKLFEVENDLSENEKGPSPVCNGGDVLEDVTDDDLMLLAQEHVAKENCRFSQDAPLENQSVVPSEEKKVLEKQTAVKKTSKFSLNNWKGISSQLDLGASLNITDSRDLETLKTYSRQADSQSRSQHLEEPYTDDVGDEAFRSLQTRSAAEGESMTAPDADKDSIANDMLGLILGSSLSASIVPPSQVPRKEASTDIVGEQSNGADKYRSVQASSSKEWSPKSAATGLPATVERNTEDLSVEFKPKKKSSLKDKIKMLLD